MEKKKYKIGICCSNCSYGIYGNCWMEIPKGIEVVDFFKDEKCPNCGCLTLKKKL